MSKAPQKEVRAVATYLARLPVLEAERKPAIWQPDALRIVEMLIARGWSPPSAVDSAGSTVLATPRGNTHKEPR